MIARLNRRFLVVALLVGSPSLLFAQPVPAPENVVQLSASATVEATQDLLVLSLQVTCEGSDAAQVQSQLKTVLEAALTEARRVAQPGALDVRTGAFAIGPRSGRDGRIASWQGTAELLLEGTDFARIAQLAGRLPGMAVAGSSFRLSRSARDAAEREAQLQAVTAFRVRAGELARGFGFSGFGLREVSVQAQDQGSPRPMAAVVMARAASDEPVPVEAGKAGVAVQVSGTVQLR